MKKLLVISDIHRARGALRRIIHAEKDADALIFLGDGIDDLDVVQEEAPRMPVYSVRGNCDLGSYEPLDGLVAFEGVLFYYTHGHIYNVKYGTDDLEQAAREKGADVALFGHTHRPILKNGQDVTLFNPGSAGQSYSGNDSYGVITLGGGGTIDFEHRMVPEQ